MTTAQVDFTEAELLADHDYVEPLVVDGVRCHGGFDDDGHLRLAPHRQPLAGHRGLGGAAGRAVRHRRCSTSRSRPGPSSFPNVEQSKLLLRNGVHRADRRRAHPHRHGRGLRRLLRTLPMPDLQPGRSTRTSRHRHRPPRPRACSRRTPATRPASRTRPATTACGSSPATSPSRTRSPTTRRPACSSAWASTRPRRRAEQLDRAARRGHGQPACCPTTSTSRSRWCVEPHDRAAAHRDLRLPRRSRGPRRVLSDTELVRRRRRGRPHHLATCGPTRRRTSPTCARRCPRCATAPGSASAAAATTGTEMIRPAVGPGARATRCCCAGPSACSVTMDEIERALDGPRATRTTSSTRC